MNDLQNALEQLRCRASRGGEPLHLSPKAAQALLDERDALRRALESLYDAVGDFHFAGPDDRPESAWQEAGNKMRQAWKQAFIALARAEQQESHTGWKAIAQAEVESFGPVTAEEVRQLNEPVKDHIIAAITKASL